MADQNLDIVIRVRGGQVASSEIKGVAKATDQVGTSSETASKKTGGLGKTMRGLATGFAVYKGYQFIKSAVGETISLAKSTAGLSRITGMDTRTASGWVGLAKQRGIQSKALNMGFIALSRNMQGAAAGSKTSAKAFEQLGISQKQLKTSTPQQTLNRISDAFAKMPDGAQKATLAQKLFGRASQGLLPLLNKGSKELNDQVGAMSKHIGMSKSDMERSLEMAKQQRELNATMMGFKVAVGSALLPIMTQIAKVIVPVVEGFAKLMQGSAAFRIVVIGLTAAIIALNIAMSLNPIVLIAIGVAALVAALVLAYTKVTWFRNAINAVFEFIKSHWRLLLAVFFGPLGVAVGFIISHFGMIKNAAVAAFNFMKQVILSAIRAASSAFNWIKNAASNTFNWVKGAAHAVGSAISSAFNTGINAAKTAIHGLESVATGVFNAIKGAAAAVVGAAKGIINTVITGWNTLHFSIPGFKVGPVHFGGVTIGLPQIPLLAAGGTITAPGMAIVGERGPELVSLPQGATVTPATAAAGVGRQEVHTHVYLEGREIAHAIGSYVAGQQAAR